jgi:hypothetical protein
MPATTPGPDNDLADKLAHYVSRESADPDARLYAFGRRWGPESGVPDKIFGFAPGNGIHDVHMNQGNSGRFTADDGIWQDGGLLLHFPTSYQWVAIFLAFQSQAWHTDDRTGHAVPGLDQLGPGPLPSPAEPDRTVRIVAALVNPIGPGPEPETATLINPGAVAVDLTGWRLVDRMGRAMILDRTVLPAGDTIRIRLSPHVQLGNSGGLLTLLNARGLKVDGIAYTAEDAHSEGKTLVF